MLRIIGLLGLVAASGLVGIMKASELKTRILLLENMQNLVLELKSQMGYFREPLLQIFEKTALKSDSKAFSLPGACLTDLYEKNGDICHIWTQKAKEIYKRSPLSAEDLEILCHMGDYLGQTDFENQKMQFQCTEDRLVRQLEEARKIYLQKGAMYRKTGFFFGILAALVLL